MRQLDKKTVETVLERDGHACVVCGYPVSGERGISWSIHHRRPRGMGGSKRPDTNSPVNLVTVDGSGTTGCHGWLESHRAGAFCNGFLLMQHSDPAAIPLLLHGNRWVYLTEDGQYSDDPPEAAA